LVHGRLGVSKQGDDLRDAIASQDGDNAKGLEAAAEMYDEAAAHLRAIKDALGDRANETEIDGDTHLITITGPDELIDRLRSECLLDGDGDWETAEPS
jgi:hypothetical protein